MSKRAPTTYVKSLPLGLTSFKGFNMPWIITHLGDGYSVGFTTFWDQTDIQNKLNLVAASGAKYVRIWLNMSFYMTTNASGYTGFSATFLTHLDTLINTILPAAGLKGYICMSDSNSEFQWAWLNDVTKSANYVTAYNDIFTRYANNANIWAWDFANEPLDKYVDNGVTRATLLAFCTSIYNNGKITTPNHYFSIGGRGIGNSDFDVCCDFNDIHLYNTTGQIAHLASEYTQPVILSECGNSNSALFARDETAIRQFFITALEAGYNLVMPWDSRYLTALNTPSGNTYQMNGPTIVTMFGMNEPSGGTINF